MLWIQKIWTHESWVSSTKEKELFWWWEKEKYNGHLDDLDSEKSSSSDDEQVNIYLMINTDEKVDVKTCYEFETSFVVSSDDEEEMPYDIILQNYYDLSSVRKI